MKKHKKTVIITTLLTLFPILIGLLLWDRMPDTVAVHWGMDNEANGWASKTFAVFGMPCFLAVRHLFTMGVILSVPKKKNIHNKLLNLVFWIVPVISLVCNIFIYLIAIGKDINISFIIPVLVGFLFVVLGNYMPKLQQNYTVGIKLPWTLNSEENWYRTHRLGGKLFMVGGFLIMVEGVFSSVLSEEIAFIVLMVILMVCTVIPLGYSFWLFKKGV